jgi:hypothetical protein
MVDVVSDQRDLIAQSEILDGPLQNGITGSIAGHEVGQRMAFRRGILQMPHVEINPSGIRQEPAVPRRFVVPAMMQIQHALPLNVEDMITDLVREPGR